ncbi:MAG TPA: membrane protein insertase YidC [Marmoricola sp.]|nr:membrane protein insertase YidC [Marmoricola sp.]
MSFFSQIGSFIMTPLYYLISVVMVGFHTVFSQVLNPNGAWAWGLSIIGLTVLIRAALIPLFVKQIKSSRNMQLLQPKVKELQKKYGHDRERLAQETMALYKETGTNPLASCLPLLIQMPIFWALFRLIDHAAGSEHQGHGVLTTSLAESFANAPFFGGTLASSFTHSNGSLSIKIAAGVLVLAMIATTFMTQRQLMAKNMPPDAMTGQYAQQQKMLLYVLPLVFGVGGIAFPIGVLFYWTTSNLWTMGQQFYVIRNNPAPGTPAFAAKQKRDAEKARHHGRTTTETSEATTGGTATATVEDDTSARRAAQRQQPRRQSRQQRRKSGPPLPQQPRSGPDDTARGDAAHETTDGPDTEPQDGKDR